MREFCQGPGPEQERRKNPMVCPLGDEAVRQLHSDIDGLRRQFATMQTSIASYMDKHDSALAAFPKKDDGAPDIEGHREYHEALIAQAKARADFWRKMTFELTKWGLFGFLGWAAYALWESFLHGPPK